MGRCGTGLPGAGLAIKTRSGGRDDVLFDALNPCDVLGGNTQRPPLPFGLLVGELEMHDSVPHKDIHRPDISPLLSLQLGEQLVAEELVTDGMILAKS